MPFTVQDVVTECQDVFLNDSTSYTSAKLIPFVKRAYDDAQRIFEIYDMSVQREVSAPITIPVGNTTLGYTTVPALPSNFLYPLHIHELAPGATVYQPMDQEMWSPNVEVSDMLRWWIYMGGELRFVGANRDVQIKLQYIEGFPTISALGDTIRIVDTLKSFLSAQASAYASMFKGQNQTRAEACQTAAEMAMKSIVKKLVHLAQQNPVRLRPFRRPRRTYQWRR